jgi:hypothetical protein
MTHTNSWKKLERDTAKILGGSRVIRTNWGEKNTDVAIEDFPNFKIDTKRYKKFQTFTLYDILKKKYCKKSEDQAILILREWNRKTSLAVIDLKLLSKFLDYIRDNKEQDKFNKK